MLSIRQGCAALIAACVTFMVAPVALATAGQSASSPTAKGQAPDRQFLSEGTGDRVQQAFDKPTPKRLKLLESSLRTPGLGTTESSRGPLADLNCDNVPADKRCWWYTLGYSPRSENPRTAWRRKQVDRQGCSQTSSDGYLFQDNPDFVRRWPDDFDWDLGSDDNELPWELVDQASLQLGYGTEQYPDCRLNPRVDFTTTDAQVGANPEITITTDFTNDSKQLPFEEVYLTFPKGMQIDAQAAPSCEEKPEGTDAYKYDIWGNWKGDCPLESKIGEMLITATFYPLDMPIPSIDSYGYVFLGKLGAEPGDPPGTVGRLWLAVDSQLWGIQLGDDVVMEILIYEESGLIKGQWLDIPRYKEDVLGGIYLATEKFKFSLDGAIGPADHKLLTNPGASDCQPGDRGTYRALHKSWVNDVDWPPNIFDPGIPADDQEYVNLAWSGFDWEGCTG